MTPRRTFVTGFRPWAAFTVNPSELLAESCGRPFERLEVSFAAVDEFLDRIAAAEGAFDRLLMLGLNGGGTTVRLEWTARNHVGDGADVGGAVRGPGPIEPGGPPTLPTTLFDASPPLALFATSDDAGSYLCNYVYYRALRRLPHKRVGFVHVPPPEVVPLDAQRRQLAALLDAIEAGEANRPAAAIG